VIDVLAKQPLRRSAGKALGAAADAITLGIDRHRSEQALRESELKFHTLVEEAPDAIISFDPLGRYELFNPAAVRMSGLAASEVLGRTITQAALFAPASLTRIVEELAYVLEGRERPPFEVEIVRRDGGKLTMEASGRGVVREGITTGVQATLRDVTARKVEAEKRKELEEQLRQALKMEAVGRLAGGIAHDFNNLLAVILNYASIVIEELRDSDPTKQDVEEILKAATRAASLTKQLLIFSRREVIQPEVLDLNEVVADMERLLRRTIGEDVALVTSFSSSLRRVNADRGQVEQVIMNLALNARDAMPNGGRLTIETANVDVEGSRPAGLEAGRYVRLSVADTGHGMTDEIASRAFEPFFTTKPKGKGTGLGLSTVYGIVKQASGHIDIVTRPGVGTRFEIFLPPTDRPERSRSGISTQAMQALRKRKTTGNETVLVAEDEDGVRALTCRILARNGYTVLEARGPGDALLASEQYDGRIDLLLSDVVMPQMSGRELAERLLRIRSDMRVLYMSGYPGDVIAQHQIEEGTVDLIQKPFTEEALMAKVRDVLERPPANITTVG
jgi:PAS domain S-box-containing protein